MNRTSALLAVLLLPLLAACQNWGGYGSRSPEETFRSIHRACLKGDFAAAHRLYSHRLQQALPLEKLRASYATPELRDAAEALMKDVQFRVEHYSLNHAFAAVRWSDGSEQRMTFVLEDGEWKLDITAVTGAAASQQN